MHNQVMAAIPLFKYTASFTLIAFFLPDVSVGCYYETDRAAALEQFAASTDQCVNGFSWPRTSDSIPTVLKLL